MSLNTKYYLLTETSESNYGNTPSNALSVPRLLQHKPYWKQAFGNKIKKNKVLVINDPDILKALYDPDIANNWLRINNRRIVLAERLKALQQQGFKIFSHKSNKLIELVTTSLTDPQSIFDKEHLLSDKKAIELAAKHLELSHDEIFVLNAQELYELVQGGDEYWEDLASFERVDLQETNISAASLVRLLQTSGPRIRVLDLSHCVNLQSGSFPDNIVLTRLEELHLGGHSSENQTVSALGYNKQFPRITNLDPPFINRMIKASPNLKVLNLRYLNCISDELFNDVNLDSLEELDLSHSNIKSDLLNKLLTKTPRLKRLKLNGCQYLESNTPNPIKLAFLETLELAKSTYAGRPDITQVFCDILSKTIGIKQLLLANSYISTDELFHILNTVNLSSLEVLDLSHTWMNTDQINKLLAKTPKLKILRLANSPYLHNPQVLHIPSSLEELDFWDDYRNSVDININEYLARTKLKSVKLACIKNLQDIELDYPELTVFELNHAKIERISLKTPNLKKLSLKNCSLYTVEPHHLYSLENLDVSQSSIEDDSFFEMFDKAPKLKKIDLSRVTFSASTKKIKFESLECLNISNSAITSRKLEKLLNDAPRLNTLDLSVCINLTAPFSEGVNLPSLADLNLRSSKVNSLVLNKLLASASGLKCLDLSYCTVLGNHFPDDINLSSLEELKIDYATLSPSILNKIKSKAPQSLKIIGNLKDNMPALTAILNTSATGILGAPKQQSAQTEQCLDADTTYKDTTFHIQRIFYANQGPHPAPNHYRLQTFNDFVVQSEHCTAKNAFTLINRSDALELEAKSIPESAIDLKSTLSPLPDANPFYGIQTIPLSDQWMSLASLSAEEEMTAFHLSQPLDVDIAYSHRDNMYYIRKKPGSISDVTIVTIDFIIKVPKQVNKLPRDIANMVRECLNFTDMPLYLDKTNPTGQDYLEALKQQQTGACRHRSLVFKDWMREHHPELPTRIVYNDCHSFAEVYYNNHWIICELGGYPATLNISDPKQSESAATPAAPPEHMTLSAAGTIEPISSTTHYFPVTPPEQNRPSETPLYMEHLLSSENKKILMQCHNAEEIAGFRHHLQKYAQSISKPCFYIHSPEDLICSAPYIKREGETGIIKKGPGGPLHDFLERHRNDGSTPILIVNYDSFSPSDIVRFNSLLDTVRYADGSKLPEAAKVIGLMNPDKPGAYDGADFRSRFDDIKPNPLSKEQLSLPKVTTNIPAQSSDNRATIHLYGGNDWEERLLGHWEMRGTQLHFIEGELVTALKAQKTHIDLHNAPWGDEAFECFWQQALLYRSFDVQGVTYSLPKDFALTRQDGISFQETRQRIRLNETAMIPADALVLNPGMFSQFFGRYVCDHQHQTIQFEAGLLAKHQSQTISLYLTNPLGTDAWALFLDTCKKHDVHIHLTLAPGVTLPKEMDIRSSTPSKPIERPAWSSSNHPDTAYVASTDIDFTLTQLEEDGAMIIDVSEVSPADLLMRLDGRFDDSTLSFQFTEQEGALLKALRDNKTVILKGQVKNELRDILSDFLLKRQHEQHPQGRLLVISDQAELFPMIDSFTHAISYQDKQSLFPHVPRAALETHSLAELKAMKRHTDNHPNDKGTKAWEGLRSLPEYQTPTDYDLKHAQQVAQNFNQQRLKNVEQTLNNSPFVFLAGMTGVGKTTFIHEVWKKHHQAVHIGEANILAWANDTTAGPKILFIDEANISSRQWSEFEGLFHEPPGILIGNEFKRLSKDHKVIFAGNPLSYGGERQLPSLFARHGNSVLFEPMPPEYLYHELLKPIFEQAKLNSDELARPILDVALYLTGLNKDKVLISPRELSMMALLTVAYCQSHPDANPKEVSQYYAFVLAQGFVPEEYKAAFIAQFNTDRPKQSSDIKTIDFLITPTNQAAFDALNDALRLRASRRNGTIQIDGGLGGIVLEGEPGLGKTELVVKTLVAHGFKKGKLEKEYPNKQVFYAMPVSMSFSEKEKLLLKAFHEGAIVVIDEINSAPMMERLLNDLLMGKDPHGKPPARPGFMLIGTQNPPTMAGRIRASTALEHRLQKVIIPEYHRQEMINILVKKGLPIDISRDMVAEYLIRRDEARKNATTELCFRDLLKRAKQEIEALSKLDKKVTRPEPAPEENSSNKNQSRLTLFKPVIAPLESEAEQLESHLNKLTDSPH